MVRPSALSHSRQVARSCTVQERTQPPYISVGLPTIPHRPGALAIRLFNTFPFLCTYRQLAEEISPPASLEHTEHTETALRKANRENLSFLFVFLSVFSSVFSVPSLCALAKRVFSPCKLAASTGLAS